MIDKPQIDDGELLAGLAFLARYAHPDYGPALKLASDAVVAVRAKRKQEETRLLPLDDLELSVTAACALQKLGIATAGELEHFMAASDEELLRGPRAIRDFGAKRIKEVRTLLHNIGLEPSRGHT